MKKAGPGTDSQFRKQAGEQTPEQMRLIDGWQRDFPLVARPFAHIAMLEGCRENELIEQVGELLEQGALSRVGAVVRPNTAGASTLAAIRVPPRELLRVASIVNNEPGVNHNYEREHEFNLWFVATAADRRGIGELLERVSRKTGLEVLNLPLTKAHHIDLGFGLGGGDCPSHAIHPPKTAPENVCGNMAATKLPHLQKIRVQSPQLQTQVSERNKALLAAIEDGLPLVSTPFALVGESLGMDEAEVIERLSRLLADGVISRFGFVVRHRRMGFTNNAMAVWDVDEQTASEMGERFAAQPFVTLCYQRQRAMPHWPYNLYCMIHGRERPVVLEQIKQLNRIMGENSRAHEVLFSNRCFRQRGARFSGKKPPGAMKPLEIREQSGIIERDGAKNEISFGEDGVKVVKERPGKKAAVKNRADWLAGEAFHV